MSIMGTIQPLSPTVRSIIVSTSDAVQLVKACLDGTYNHVPRGPYKSEWQEVVQPGNVFVYEESASGVEQWNDNLTWSIVETGPDLTIEEGPKLVAGLHNISAPQVIRLSMRVVFHGITHHIVSYQACSEGPQTSQSSISML